MSIRYAMLALLYEGPKFGLQLQHEFEEGTGEVWPLNAGQVYSTLRRLERDGLVSAEDGDGPQQTYALTEDGSADLAEWLQSPPVASAPPRDELLIKVLIAFRLPDIDLRSLIQVHRRQILEAMQQYTWLKREAPATDVALMLAVDAELFRLDALVRWLDAAESRIRGRGDDLHDDSRSKRSAPERLRRKVARR